MPSRRRVPASPSKPKPRGVSGRIEKTEYAKVYNSKRRVFRGSPPPAGVAPGSRSAAHQEPQVRGWCSDRSDALVRCGRLSGNTLLSCDGVS